MKRICRAVVPAAGLGTRLLPTTKVVPKELFPIADKPVIQYIVEEAVESGIEQILLITSKAKTAVEEYFQFDAELDVILGEKGKGGMRELLRSISQKASISSLRQEQAQGLGHAVLLAESFAGNEPFGVFLADDIMQARTPVMKQLTNVFEHYQSSVIGVRQVPWETVSEYGVVATRPLPGPFGESLFRIEGMVEKPRRDSAPSNLAIMGRYVLTPRIFKFLKNTSPGAIGEIQLTDGIQSLIEDGEPVYAYCFEGKRFEVGDPLGFLRANIELSLSREELRPTLLDYLIRLVTRHKRETE